MSQDVIGKVVALVEPIIVNAGFELVDAEYVREGIHWFLRLYIDRENGVDLDACALVSHRVGEALDKVDFIPEAYMLEVSSPGLERPLKKPADYERYQGKLIKVRTKGIFQGYQEFSGYLVGLVDGKIILEYKGEHIEIPWDQVEKAHLEIEF